MRQRSSVGSTVDRAIRSFESGPTLLRLHPGVQHYAWGDPHLIPSLLGIPNPQNKPFAELWLGAHPDLPARAEIHGAEIPLDRLIQRLPLVILGPEATGRFAARLPYLLKVLAASAPLSIQVHPSKKQAEEGFSRENAAGIPLASPNRNYKDDNHKPELIVALSDFYALKGFRPLSQIAATLREVPEFQELARDLPTTSSSLRTFYEQLMTLPQPEVDWLLDPLIRRLAARDQKTPFARTDREFWLLRADREFSKKGHRDRGLFSIYLLNLVRLRPGEGMYLPAGTLHAYLEGSGMEIMANSNNVLRGGLTEKHVDVPELLRTVTFEGGEPEVIQAEPIEAPQEWVYRTPAREFELQRIQIGAGQDYYSGHPHSTEIAIVISTTAAVAAHASEQRLNFAKGEAFLAPFGIDYRLHTNGTAVLYKATVPSEDFANGETDQPSL